MLETGEVILETGVTPIKKEPYRRLAEINRAITTSLNFDQVLQLIVTNAAQLVDAPISLLLLLDKNDHLRIRAAHGIDEQLTASFSGNMEEDVVREIHDSLHLADDDVMYSVPVITNSALSGLL